MLLFDDYKKILYEKINKIYKEKEENPEINKEIELLGEQYERGDDEFLILPTCIGPVGFELVCSINAFEVS